MEGRREREVPGMKELEAGRWIMYGLIEENPVYADLPGITKAYISLMLLHPALKMYLEEGRKEDFMLYSYTEKYKLYEKFQNIISDLHKWARPGINTENRGRKTDLSPVRRAALVQFWWWRKFINNKEYYLNWQEGRKDNILFFSELDYDTYITKYLEKLAKMKKGELLKMLSRQEKRKQKKRKKEHKPGEERRRQALLFPFPSENHPNDGGGANEK